MHSGFVEQSWGACGALCSCLEGRAACERVNVRSGANAAAVEGILNLPEEKECVVIGTAYKEMKLKPNILDEYVKVPHPTPPHPLTICKAKSYVLSMLCWHQCRLIFETWKRVCTCAICHWESPSAWI